MLSFDCQNLKLRIKKNLQMLHFYIGILDLRTM